MDHRTRIKNFFTFKPIDRIPFIDWGGHPCFYMDRWKKKGSIPADADPFVLAGYDGSEGPGTEEIVPGSSEYRGHLYVPTKGLEHVYFNIYALPEFAAREWTDEEGYIYRTSPLMGGVAKIKPATAENSLGGLTTFKNPITTWDELKEYKTHFNGKDIDRYPFRAGECEIKRYRETKLSVNLQIPGIWTYALGRIGWENAFERYVDEPDFITAVLEFFTEFGIDLAIPALERFQIDTGSIGDILGYTGGLWFSKQILRDLILPLYKRQVAKMKEHGITYVYLDSIGRLQKFLPDFIDIGINGFYPVSMADGMDVVELKKEYGKDLVLMGGIDRRIVSNGTKEEIKKEVERVMSVVHIGGYLPFIDQSVFVDTPAENYFYCADILGRSLGAK